jgi:hypothetical protein
MSKAAVQSFTILAIANGCAITMRDYGIAGKAEPIIIYLCDLIKEKIDKWPETGNPNKTTLACINHCKALKNDIESSASIYTACCLGMLAQYLLIELRDLIRDKVKLSAIDEILECFNNAVDIYDPHEKDGAARDEAMRLVFVVKNQIGMD